MIPLPNQACACIFEDVTDQEASEKKRKETNQSLHQMIEKAINVLMMDKPTQEDLQWMSINFSSIFIFTISCVRVYLDLRKLEQKRRK